MTVLNLEELDATVREEELDDTIQDISEPEDYCESDDTSGCSDE